MTKKNLEFKIEYRRPTGRNYVVADHSNEKNKPMWDPVNFFIARYLLTKKKHLKKIIPRWLHSERPSLVGRLKKEGKTPLFDLEREYQLDPALITEIPVGQLELNFEGKKRVKKRITDLGEKLFDVVREKSKERFGSYKIVDLDYRTFLIPHDPKNQKKKTDCGTIVLTVYMKSRGDGRKGRRYHHVTIKGPFENSEKPFALLNSDSEDFDYALKKGGYDPNQLAAIEIAAALLLASRRPKLINNLENILKKRKSKIRLPFHVHEINSSLEEVFYTVTGKQPDSVNLMIDVVCDYIFNKHTKYKISKAVTKLPIYDKYLLTKFEKGEARFEAIPNEFIFGSSSIIHPVVLNWLGQMHSHYTKNGFEYKGQVVEKKDSEHENIVFEYVKKNDEKKITEVKRLIFGGQPPIERKMIFDDDPESKTYSKPDVFFMERQEKQPNYVNPYKELFKPHYGRGIKLEDFDDASRRMPIFSEYRLPWFITIQNKDLLQDYHTVIDAYFNKGYSNFTRWLHKRDNILEGTLYKSERMNVNLFLKNLKAK